MKKHIRSLLKEGKSNHIQVFYQKKRTLFFLFFFFIILSSSVFSQTIWRALPKPTSKNLSVVFFVDSLTGWVAGEGGTILKTTNGGKIWTPQVSSIVDEIIDLFMLDYDIGWALVYVPLIQPGDWYGTILLKTTDGGNLWTKELYPDLFLYTVYFKDSLNGWVGGYDGVLLGTNDGGERWFVPEIDPSFYTHFPIQKIAFLNSQYGYAVGGKRELAGVIWKTTNGGQHWSVYGTADEVLDIHYFDSTKILCVGGGLDDGAAKIITNNAGTEWVFHYVGPFGQALAVAFRTPSEGYSPLLNTGTYMYSLDSGNTWTGRFTPDSTACTDICFPDSRHGFMVGKKGAIFEYNTPQVLQVKSLWNLISVPLSISNTQKDILFPSSTSSAFAFGESGYSATDSLTMGKGYWLKFNSDESISIQGDPVLVDTVSLHEGWNIIGSISSAVPVASIITQPANIISSQFFSYQNGYTAVDTLQPGKGYWIKALSPGLIILQAQE